MNTLIILVFLLLLLTPLIGWARAWRDRQISAARLRLVRAVTETELLVLDGTLTHHDICHSRVHQAMSRAQFATTFPLPKRTTLGSADVEPIHILNTELVGKKARALVPILEFGRAFFTAAALTHPIRFAGLVLCQLAITALSRVRRGHIDLRGTVDTAFAALRERIAGFAFSRGFADS